MDKMAKLTVDREDLIRIITAYPDAPIVADVWQVTDEGKDLFCDVDESSCHIEETWVGEHGTYSKDEVLSDSENIADFMKREFPEKFLPIRGKEPWDEKINSFIEDFVKDFIKSLQWEKVIVLIVRVPVDYF